MIYPNIRTLLSAFFDKGLTTFGASDFNSPFSPGNADLLPAGRASVDMMRLSLLEIPLPSGKIFLHSVLILQISVIFEAALIGIFGKHPKVRINQTCQPSQIKASHSKERYHEKYKGEYHQKAVKLIISISSHHKTV